MEPRLIALSVLLVIWVTFSGCIQQPAESGSDNVSESVEEGLSVELKKEIYFELVKYQDDISFDDSDYAQKQQDAYKVLADRYEVEESEIRSLVVEGSKELWPVPPFPKN